MNSRCTHFEIRTPSLSPAGVRSSLVMDQIIGDLMIAGTKGVPSIIDALGRKCVIFVEIAAH